MSITKPLNNEQLLQALESMLRLEFLADVQNQRFDLAAVGTMTADDFENALIGIALADESGLGNIFKKWHKKYNPVRVLKQTRKVAKKVHKEINPRAVIEKTKKFAKNVNKQIKAAAKKALPIVRKIIIAVVAAMIIYYSAGTATKYVVNMYNKYQAVKVQSKEAKRMIAQQAQAEYDRAMADEQYKQQILLQAEQDPLFDQAVTGMEKQENMKKWAVPMAAGIAAGFLV